MRVQIRAGGLSEGEEDAGGDGAGKWVGERWGGAPHPLRAGMVENLSLLTQAPTCKAKCVAQPP